jgi:endonuclease/exonuclease/phosphatase family metal-dependent hydrolase
MPVRIGESSSLPPSSPAVKAAPAPAAAPTPAMAGDSFKSDANNVDVVTFNVAGGASKFKREEKLIDTQLFQKLIKGDADAPIVACQEMTPALAKKLIEASKNGNFDVIYPGHPNTPKWVPISTLMQGNMILVPKRYQVQKTEAKTFSGRAGQFFDAVKGVLFHHKKPNTLLLAVQNRGYVEGQLKDTKTGKSFSVIATHVAYDDAVRRNETPQLAEVIKKAQAKGPTLVMGDFNVPTPEKMTKPNQGATDFWKGLESADLKDMGPEGKDAGTFWGNNQDIDSVLATGFKPVASEILKGDKMTIPGHPDAKEVSDHYAEADTIAFE